jgi:hypothetical protein
MKGIKFEELTKNGKPAIFHNAWNLDEQKLALFSNREMETAGKEYQYKGAIDARSLCACSALPFVEGTVEIGGVTYCEGALVDTVNFESLLEEHHKPPDDKLDEIWVSRIVDSKQIRKPENLHDALANLCQLFAATVGEDDVKLFKYHVRYDTESRRTGRGRIGGPAGSSRFTCRGTSISNGITATWKTGERWGKPLRNKQSRHIRKLRNKKSRHIRKMKNLCRIPGHIL